MFVLRRVARRCYPCGAPRSRVKRQGEPMDVAQAVRRRISTRAFRPDPPPRDLVRRLIEEAARAPSGGNLQPWRVYALTGAPLAEFKALVAASPMEEPEYDVYPPNLWEPLRTRRFVC